MKVQDNNCNNNLLILNIKQLNKITKLYYFHTLKALWDGQGKIKMYYGMSRVKKQLSGKRSIEIYKYLDGLSPAILSEVFKVIDTIPYDLRMGNKLHARNPKTVRY